MGIYAYFRCPLLLTLGMPLSSALGVKGISGDPGVTPWPNDSCRGCWDEHLREGTRVPWRAHPVFMRVLGT